MRRLFSYDDIAIVEAMEQAFGPPLETLLASEQREVSLKQLAHEVKVPVVAFRAVLERMQREYDQSTFRFQHSYFREANIYLDLMNRLVKELDIVRLGPSEVPLVLQETNLLADVINPDRRFIQPILRARKMLLQQLVHSGFESLPRLRVDAALITQVIFNLLENAIKYFPRDRPASEFKCSIHAEIAERCVEICVSDNGLGIVESDRERLFEFGIRGINAEQFDVQGGGLGLWISRAIARRHGGDLELRSLGRPTEFVLSLPLSLRGEPSIRFLKTTGGMT